MKKAFRTITVGVSLALSLNSYPQEEQAIANITAGAYITAMGALFCYCTVLACCVGKNRKDIIETTAKSANPNIVITNIHNADNHCAQTIQTGCRLTGCCCALATTLSLALATYLFALGAQNFNEQI